MNLTQKVFSVFDTAIGRYGIPWVAETRGAAIRQFGDLAQDKQHPFGQHPEDYVLFELGEFDSVNASFYANGQGPERVIAAHECEGVARPVVGASEVPKVGADMLRGNGDYSDFVKERSDG